MRVFSDKRAGKAIALSDKPFAKGGEGKLYELTADSTRLAKVYHPEKRTREREAKLEAMLLTRPKGSDGSIAWPERLIYDSAGRFMGFIMPRIDGVSKINALYSYDVRSKHRWDWYIFVARNLCAAVGKVHESGNAVGDLNPANICADPKTGLVTLVDTDSYQINLRGRSYPCVVCMPEYLPPELHELRSRKDFDLSKPPKPVFTRETDLFALAVHIFALLMNGCHPFACVVTDDVSASKFSIINNIKDGVFAFTGANSAVNVPQYAPPLSILTGELRALFIRAFCYSRTRPDARPTAQEWYDALGKQLNKLKPCSRNITHQYNSELGYCPWCEIEQRMNSAMQKIKLQKQLEDKNRAQRAQAAVQPPRYAPAPQSAPRPVPQVVPQQAPQQAPQSAPQPMPQPAAVQFVPPPAAAPVQKKRGCIGTLVNFFVSLVAWIVSTAIWALFAIGAQLLLWKLFPELTWITWIARILSVAILPYIPFWIFSGIRRAESAPGFFVKCANWLGAQTRVLTLLVLPLFVVFYGLAEWDFLTALEYGLGFFLPPFAFCKICPDNWTGD